MRATAVYLLFLTSTTAFVPLAPTCRYVGSRRASSAAVAYRSSSSSSKALYMSFDFKDMIEKMSDTRYARVRHILVEEKGEEGRARLEAAKIDIGGDVDKFSEVAESISTCTSAPKGGRLKLLARGETVPAFDEVAFKGELGVVHGPVETTFGTHLIWVESCNKPQNTWKMMYDEVIKTVKGDVDENQ